MKTPIWYALGLWILWMLPFILFRPKQKGTPIETAPNFRWGIVLQILGHWAIRLPDPKFRRQPIPSWQITGGAGFGLVGIWRWRSVTNERKRFPRPTMTRIGP